MTLLITSFAAIFSTVLWYKRSDDRMQFGFLSLIYWGASLMWFVDAVFEFIELKSDFFTPALKDMLNDSFLGLSVVALGLIVWLVRLLITDPYGKLRKALKK